ncbi:SDR family NAD(P)-dependent oxidoreductase [Micromonospora sp. NBC_00898]|uniref:SDR family oxidoreductase n=1 Tax=Micromonospora sp. NBC_00898 TaxID=2975981 RepID=UPI0038674188|nr:SDR family NAD(P)-dependent oxidoreductase [Micromonospora sp. NBC_00898]
MPVTLITGGATDIGAATVRELLARGHQVVATGRTQSRLAASVKEADAGDGGLLTVAGDATEPDDVRAAVEAAVERYGRLDNVVANAGFSTHDTLADGDPARPTGQAV